MVCQAIDCAELTLSALNERYDRYALRIRGHCSDTIKARRTYLNRLFDYLGPPETAADLFSELDASSLSRFLCHYAKSHGPGSRQDMHKAARCFLRFAYAERLIEQDLSPLVPAVRQLTLAKVPKALPNSCIEKLDNSIDRSTPAGLRDAAIIGLLTTYGIRGVHIRKLCLEHIDWQVERIRFAATKGGRPIVHQLTAKAGNLLAEYIAKGRPTSTHREVFLTLTEEKPLARPSSLSTIIHRRLKHANVAVPDGISRGTHGFRHAFAVRMTGKVPFKDIVDMLGHRDPSSTMIYAKADVQSLQQAALPWPGGE